MAKVKDVVQGHRVSKVKATVVSAYLGIGRSQNTSRAINIVI